VEDVRRHRRRPPDRFGGCGVTTATGVGRQAQDYLAAVEHELADLSAEDRSALPEDLALHLEALTAEDDDRPLAVRLGDPVSYAADLRAAAGLPARRDGAGWAPRICGRAGWPCSRRPRRSGSCQRPVSCCACWRSVRRGARRRIGLSRPRPVRQSRPRSAARRRGRRRVRRPRAPHAAAPAEFHPRPRRPGPHPAVARDLESGDRPVPDAAAPYPLPCGQVVEKYPLLSRYGP
jgi:hypothetical protein